MKVTMKDIAKELNISINAVSIALNDKPGVSESMRLKILRTADKRDILMKNIIIFQSFLNLIFVFLCRVIMQIQDIFILLSYVQSLNVLKN